MTSSEANFTPPRGADSPIIGGRRDAESALDGHVFGSIAIVGVGLMGGSIGLALKERGLARRIIGVGRSLEKLDRAREIGAIDGCETDLNAGVAQVDLVILCTTIGHIVDNLPAVLAAARPNAVVTDIGSTKSTIVAAADGDPRFVGGHPMCGSERAGVEAATAALYQGATWAIAPTSSTSQSAIDTVNALIAGTGALALSLTPDTHDAMVAVTSHLPHVIASALMRQASALRSTIPTLPRMSAGSFADMTRVAASHPTIWRDVCLTNRDAVLQALQAFRSELGVLEEAVAAGDATAIETFFAGGESAKRDWPNGR